MGDGVGDVGVPPPPHAERVPGAPGHRGDCRDPPLGLEGRPGRARQGTQVGTRRQRARPEHDLAGQAVDPGAVHAPEPVQRHPGDDCEDREPGEQDAHPGGCLLSDAPGGGGDLHGDGGTERGDEPGGQADARCHALAGLVCARERGVSRFGIGTSRLSFHSGKFAPYFPRWQVGGCALQVTRSCAAEPSAWRGPPVA